ncbi:unnamed protein product, partial [Rotaria sordida]
RIYASPGVKGLKEKVGQNIRVPGKTHQEQEQHILELEIVDRILKYTKDFNNESINTSIAAVEVASATPHSSTTAPEPEHIEKTFKKVLEKN